MLTEAHSHIHVYTCTCTQQRSHTKTIIVSNVNFQKKKRSKSVVTLFYLITYALCLVIEIVHLLQKICLLQYLLFLLAREVPGQSHPF